MLYTQYFLQYFHNKIRTNNNLLCKIYFLFLQLSLSLSLSLSFFLFFLDSRTFTSSLCDKNRKKRGIERKNKRDGSLCCSSSSSPSQSRWVRWHLSSVFFFIFFFFFSFFAFIVMIWLILKLCFWVCILII